MKRKLNIVLKKIILVLNFKGFSVQGKPPLSVEHNPLPFPACSQTPVQTSQTQNHAPYGEWEIFLCNQNRSQPQSVTCNYFEVEVHNFEFEIHLCASASKLCYICY